MATRTPKKKIQPVSTTVIHAEIEFIASLRDENPKDPRLKTLVEQAQDDFARWAAGMLGSDDVGKQKDQEED
jgi:hypothetical protein